MEDRERFTLLQITGKYGGSVAIELDESGAPGIPDTSGALMVHNDFVAGVHHTYVEPYDLATWERWTRSRPAETRCGASTPE